MQPAGGAPDKGVAARHAELGGAQAAVHAVELQPAALGAAGQQAAVGGGRVAQVKVSHLAVCGRAGEGEPGSAKVSSHLRRYAATSRACDNTWRLAGKQQNRRMAGSWVSAGWQEGFEVVPPHPRLRRVTQR